MPNPEPPMRAIALALGLALLAACGEFPTAGEPSGRAGYPELLPLSGLIGDAAQTGASATAGDDPDALLRARAEALSARADALRSATP